MSILKLIVDATFDDPSLESQLFTLNVMETVCCYSRLVLSKIQVSVKITCQEMLC